MGKEDGKEDSEKTWECQSSWREIFAAIAPYLSGHPSDCDVKLALMSILKEQNKISGESILFSERLLLGQTLRYRQRIINNISIDDRQQLK